MSSEGLCCQHRQEIPYTHRKHAILVSPTVEQAIGQQAFAQVCWHAGYIGFKCEAQRCLVPISMFRNQAMQGTSCMRFQVLAEAQLTHSLLPPNHRYVRLVKDVGTRIIKKATDGYGGGYSEHVRVGFC